MKQLLKQTGTLLALLFALSMVLYSTALAAGDLSIHAQNMWFSKKNFFAGDAVRVYARIHNNGPDDVRGTVQITINGAAIGAPQVVSIVPGNPDDVFVDWTAQAGAQTVSATILPENANGDNPSNNTARTTMVIDYDTDRDGVGNAQDVDDDNDGIRDTEEQALGTNQYKKDTDGDGVIDSKDAFPNDPTETTDTDENGIGNNADPDDDGDGLADAEDPNDANKGPMIALQHYRFIASNAEKKTLEPLQENGTPGGNGQERDAFFIVGNPLEINGANFDETLAGYTNDTKDMLRLNTGQTLRIDAENSYDPDGAIVEYAWTVTKTPESHIVAQKISEKPYANIAFPTAGQFTIALVATDDAGESREENVTVNVVESKTASAYGMWILWIALALLLLLVYTRSRSTKKR